MMNAYNSNPSLHLALHARSARRAMASCLAARTGAGIWTILVLACCSTGCVNLTARPELASEGHKSLAQALQRAPQRDPMEMALDRWQRGNAAGTEAIVREVLSREPQHLSANLLLAEVNLYKQRPQDSLPRIERLAQQNPHDAEIQHTLALLLDSSGERETAIEHYRRAVELKPDAKLFQSSLAAALQTDHPNDQLVKNSGERSGPKVSHASIQSMAQTELYDSQLESNEASYFEKPVDIPGAPGTSPVTLVAATEEIAEPEPQQLPDATAVATGADGPVLKLSLTTKEPRAPKQPVDPVFPETSSSDDVAKEPTRSVLSFASHADAADSNDPGVTTQSSEFLTAAVQAFSTGQTEDAEAAVLNAIDVSPQNEEVAATAALLALKYNQAELAQEVVLSAMSRGVESARLYRVQGTAAYRVGDYATAEEALQRALSLDNTSALAYFLLGSTFRKVDEPEAAERCFRQARHLDPSFAGRYPVRQPCSPHWSHGRWSSVQGVSGQPEHGTLSDSSGCPMLHDRFWPLIGTLMLATAGLAFSVCFAVGIAEYRVWCLVGMALSLAAGGWGATAIERQRRQQLNASRYLNRLGDELRQTCDRSIDLPPPPMGQPWSSVLSEIVTNIRDLTEKLQLAEHSQASQSLRERRAAKMAELLTHVLDSLAEPVVVVDGFQELVFANRAAQQLFQLPPADDDTKRPLARHVSSTPLVETLADFCTRQGATTRSLEVVIDTQDANAIAYRATVNALTSDVAPKFGAVAVLRDISDLKAIQKRNAEFVSAVSHEMKTPLSGIKAYVEMLADGDAEDPETYEEFLDVISTQADRLSRLIDNLLNLARIESGVVKVQKESASLNDLLEDVLDIVRPAAEEKNITLVNDLSPLYLEVLVDRDQMMQTAINLLSNAIKYTRPQGKVLLRSRQVDTQVQFEVEDTGVGLSPEDCNNVFTKFYRVRKDQEMAPGTGLGLPLAKYIVEDVHGGRLTVSSTPEVGSVFTVTLLESRHMNSTSGVRLEAMT